MDMIMTRIKRDRKRGRRRGKGREGGRDDRDGQTDRQIDKHAARKITRNTNKQDNRQTDKINRQIIRQTHRQRARQKQTDGGRWRGAAQRASRQKGAAPVSHPRAFAASGRVRGSSRLRPPARETHVTSRSRRRMSFASFSSLPDPRSHPVRDLFFLSVVPYFTQSLRFVSLFTQFLLFLFSLSLT